jgi:hypothetical protein
MQAKMVLAGAKVTGENKLSAIGDQPSTINLSVKPAPQER